MNHTRTNASYLDSLCVSRLHLHTESKYGCCLLHLCQVRSTLTVMTACQCQFIRAWILELLSWIKQIIECNTLFMIGQQLNLNWVFPSTWEVRKNSLENLRGRLKLWLKLIQMLNVFEVILKPLPPWTQLIFEGQNWDDKPSRGSPWEVQKMDWGYAEIFASLLLSAAVFEGTWDERMRKTLHN